MCHSPYLLVLNLYFENSSMQLGRSFSVVIYPRSLTYITVVNIKNSQCSDNVYGDDTCCLPQFHSSVDTCDSSVETSGCSLHTFWEVDK